MNRSEMTSGGWEYVRIRLWILRDYPWSWNPTYSEPWHLTGYMPYTLNIL